jgi:hypothetical protein
VESPAEIDGAPSSDDQPPPIRLVVSDDLGRSRATVFFRLLLAIPHLLWVSIWGVLALLVAVVMWFAILFAARSPGGLHDFVARYLRYWTHVSAYVFLAANPFPGFAGDPGTYPVDLEIDGPARQSRLKALFRIVLALPALLLVAVLAGSGAGNGWVLTVLMTVAFLGWFAALARARMPEGLRDLGAYAIGYGAQTAGYVLLLTDRYPDSSPSRVQPAQALPPHPVRLTLADELRRSRFVTLFRILLAFPHFFWISLWSVPATVAVVVGWLAALVTGRLPRALHRFLAAYVRYWSHLTFFLTLVGGPFPGFTGAAGRYPVDIEIDPAVRQGRWSVLFRGLLAIPAFMIASALSAVLLVVAVLGWLAALAVGRMPPGLRDIGATSTRYQAQAYAYLALLTPRYPYACPAVAGPPEPEPVEDEAPFALPPEPEPSAA